jgi:hypothetical protein
MQPWTGQYGSTRIIPGGTFLRAVTTLNMPEAFGGGPAAAKPIFVTAKEKFDNFKPESPLWPDWGKEHNEEELGQAVSFSLPVR